MNTYKQFTQDDYKKIFAHELIRNQSSPFYDSDIEFLMMLSYNTLYSLMTDYRLLDEFIHPTDEMFEDEGGELDWLNL